MQESHMWFSPYAHQPDSVFTTVQRVSCCLTVFMTYMITNIMYYGIEPEKGGEMKMDLGPYSITWTELRIGKMLIKMKGVNADKNGYILQAMKLQDMWLGYTEIIHSNALTLFHSFSPV
jgi:hypothetical protein